MVEYDEEVVEVPSPTFTTSRKRRAKKHREPMDQKFLRCSKRITYRLEDFKDSASKEATMEVQPLAIIPTTSAPPAPHLTPKIVEGIAKGFLLIQAKVVSTAII